MSHPKILIQLDSDSLASTFDAVVAVDAGVEHLLQYANISASNVVPLVHGAMFTRGPAELKNTAIFVGGSDVQAGEEIGAAIAKAFFGPIRVSAMLDGNGSNTTAVAAVLCAARHLPVDQMNALVLGGTGPVGGRIARLIARQGGRVQIASRQLEKAERSREQILAKVGSAANDYVSALDSSPSSLERALTNANVVFGCGAAGVQLLSTDQLEAASNLQVAIDLNAVPPAGLAGIEATDKAKPRGGRVDYGAIGVGGLKMKIHRQSIQRLFEQNDLMLDAEEVFEIGQNLEKERAG